MVFGRWARLTATILQVDDLAGRDLGLRLRRGFGSQHEARKRMELLEYPELCVTKKLVLLSLTSVISEFELRFGCLLL